MEAITQELLVKNRNEIRNRDFAARMFIAERKLETFLKQGYRSADDIIHYVSELHKELFAPAQELK